MAKPADWLGRFIESELEAIVSWRNSTVDIHDPDSRFEDDGSNLRSTIQASELPSNPIVQITEIVSYSREPIVVVVTDGYTQIKARLFENAVGTLESEIEDKINPETKNDIIEVKDAIVASTAYGPKDEHVQLEIHEIEYKYHLRKSLKPKLPIIQCREIPRLLDEITKIRRRQYPVPGSPGAPESPKDGAGDPVTAGASHDGSYQAFNQAQMPQAQSPKSQVHSSPPHMTQRSSTTQNAIATQVPPSRKRKAPTLDEDGLEILQGNNLARPHGPGFTVPNTGPLFNKRRQFETDTKLLLGLLGNRPQGTNAQRDAAPVREPSPKKDAQPAHLSSSVPPVEHAVEDGVEQMSVDVEAEEPLPAGPSPTAVATQLPAQTLIHARSRFQDYYRRRILPDQRTLLDRADSWVPSLPGKQFPRPNVPIKLLKWWHEHPEVASPTWNDTEADTAAELPIADESSEVESDSPSEASEESDAEIPWSSSPAQSEPRKRASLPPDSSLGSDVRSSPSDLRPLPPLETEPALSNRAELPPDSSKGSSIHSSPLQKQAHITQSSSKSSARKHQQSPQNENSRGSTTASPSVAIRTPRSPNNSQASPSPNRSQLPHKVVSRIEHSSPMPSRTLQTPVNSHQLARPPTSGSIVKATQLEEDGDIEMEMSVPRELGMSAPRELEVSTSRELGMSVPREPKRSVEPASQHSAGRAPDHVGERRSDQDPSLTHRQNRRHFLRLGQREKWLRENYMYDAFAKFFSGAAVLKKYRAAYPKDDVNLPDFVETLETVFPSLYPKSSQAAVGGLTIVLTSAEDKQQQQQEEKVTPAKTPQVRDSSIEDIGMTGTDSGAVGAATIFRGVSTESGRGVVIDHNNGKDFRNHATPSTAKTTPLRAKPRHRARHSPARTGGRTAGSVTNNYSEISQETTNAESGPGGPSKNHGADERRKKSNFEEFERAMRNVRPGGAFAEARIPLRTRRRDGRIGSGRLDVMSWDI